MVNTKLHELIYESFNHIKGGAGGNDLLDVGVF